MDLLIEKTVECVLGEVVCVCVCVSGGGREGEGGVACRC